MYTISQEQLDESKKRWEQEVNRRISEMTKSGKYHKLFTLPSGEFDKAKWDEVSEFIENKVSCAFGERLRTFDIFEVGHVGRKPILCVAFVSVENENQFGLSVYKLIDMGVEGLLPGAGCFLGSTRYIWRDVSGSDFPIDILK